ncbi:DUF434 domain-containing protein [Methanolobus chelungpuianus]|uniref:DUF434 domain-containing protein n=1 Tax=Methanolobus chelungpuianus TaxID=502115 RepID=UPI002113F988|nr:DUF434 domain-containing protein [Methanolobus chelungpuianus]
MTSGDRDKIMCFNMKYPEEGLLLAARDIRYLLGRGYPKSSAIRFVADHYGLEKSRRYILSRNVLAPNIASARNRKRVPCTCISDRPVLIDGYNVLITLESYLKGEEMWMGDDGFIRDNRGVFRSHVNDNETFRSVGMMLSFLRTNAAGEVTVVLDRQMSMSGQLALTIRQCMAGTGMAGQVINSGSADHDLKKARSHDIVASADGVIIDAVAEVIDIPACIISGDHHSRKSLYSLGAVQPDQENIEI